MRRSAGVDWADEADVSASRHLPEVLFFFPFTTGASKGRSSDVDASHLGQNIAVVDKINVPVNSVSLDVDEYQSSCEGTGGDSRSVALTSNAKKAKEANIS